MHIPTERDSCLDKNKMVINTLTDELIKEGVNLLEKLDTLGINVNAAFWIFSPDTEYWKLMISFPGIEVKGPKAMYSKVQKALSKITKRHAVSLDDIVLVKLNAPILQLLRMAIRTGPGIHGIRFSNNVINGQLIADAYIYRL